MASANPIEAFLLDLDDRWGGADPAIPLKVIGSTALMLQADYRRGTRDSDVLGLEPLTGAVKERLLALAGQGSRLHNLHQVYLDVVAPGLPFLPHPPRFIPCKALNHHLISFQVSLLDIVDVVVSKLKRFSRNDKEDIRAMVDLERVEHGPLLERFWSAIDWFEMDARADDLPTVVRHFHWVERECFSVGPTPIQLPPWADPG